MKTVIIIQARMDSTRFPGKILEKIGQRELLVFQYERLVKSEKADLIVVATTTNILDDRVEGLCIKYGIPCFRGAEEDVLQRYRDAAELYDADVIVRINADCPFIDSVEVDHVITTWLDGQPVIDYAANILEETYPIGMHIEVFSRAALERAASNASSPDEREHVTPYIYRNPDLFHLHSITSFENLSKFRWTVDYPEDLDFVRKVTDALLLKHSNFGMWDIVNLLRKQPELTYINDQFKKKQNLL